MAKPVSQDSRSAIERAKFFLAKATECTVASRMDFEAYLEASIIFGRSVLHRLQSEHKQNPNFKTWWDSLEGDTSVNFFREHRNIILKEGPPKIGQVLSMPPPIKLSLKLGGDTSTNELDEIDDSESKAEKSYNASDLYYFEDPSIPATETVEKHLDQLEQHMRAFLATS